MKRLPLLARPLGIYLASRAVVAIGAAIATVVRRPDLTFVQALAGWDGGWYLAVARHGYPGEVPLADGEALQSTLGFFPLFPAVVRLVVAVTGIPYRPAGLLLSTAFGAGAAVLCWLLARRLSGPDAADRGVALLCFFPGALVLSMAYSEALLLLLAIGCLIALLRERWLVAGALAALATAARPNGVALVAACAWAALAAARRQGRLRPLVAPLLAPGGLLAFTAFLHLHAGDAAAYFRTQREGWKQDLDPFSTFRLVGRFLDQPLADVNVIVPVLGLLFLAVAVPVLLRSRYPGAVIVYALAVLAMALSTDAMSGRPRFILTAFPLLTALGVRLSGLGFTAVLGSLATLLGAFTVLTLATIAATP